MHKVPGKDEVIIPQEVDMQLARTKEEANDLAADWAETMLHRLHHGESPRKVANAAEMAWYYALQAVSLSTPDTFCGIKETPQS